VIDAGRGRETTRPPTLPERSNPISQGAAWITSAEHQRSGTVLPTLAVLIDVGPGLSRARLDVACLGVLRVTIDGHSVSADVLEPGYADWVTEAEYTGWDVTRLLGPGTHVLCLELAGGMYRSFRDDDRWLKVATDLGDIAAAVTLRLEGESSGPRTIASDPGWHATRGATTRSNFVGGEDYDATLEPDSSVSGVAEWEHAVLASVPATLSLVAKSTSPVQIVDRLPARSVTKVGEALVFDFGQNAAGWPTLNLPANSSVRLRPAELLHDDGSVDVRTQGWGPVYHTVRTGEAPLTWHPKFMYNGLRYLEVSGLADLAVDDAWIEVLSAAVERSGEFHCSDDRLNSIWHITRESIRSNMMSVFTDCPQREKLGYLEQIHLLHDLLVRTYRCEPLLDRMLELTVGAQRQDGSIGLYAPEWQDFADPWRGDPNWGGAVVLLPLARYRATGDTGQLTSALPAMRRYLDFLLGDRDGRGVLRSGLGDFNGASTQKFRSVSLVSTASLHMLLQRAAVCADLIGESDAASAWRTSADVVAVDFTREFISGSATIGDDLLGELVFALDAGVAPAGTIDLIDRRICDDDFVLDVGEVAMAHLVDQLARAGRHDTLFGITRVTEAPSYGYMLAHGATTLTETWDGPTFGFSQNHFMNGAIASWFHEYVLGIRQSPGSAGWSAPLINPVLVGDLTAADGWYDAPGGRIVVSWRIVDGEFSIEGDAPHAVLQLPSGAQVAVAGTFSFKERVAR